MASKRRSNPFTNRKASVSLHRNGLSIEIQDVGATDAGALHGGGFETPDEEGIEDWKMPPEAKRRRIGF